MIGIDSLYNTVTKYLVLKGKGGYGSNAQFNDDVRRAQLYLLNYYINRYDESSIIEESLSPFIVETSFDLAAYTAAKPTDFRHKISAKYEYALNNADCTDTTLKGFPLVELTVNDWFSTHASTIRGASLEKERGYYSIINDTMRFSFKNGTVTMNYIKVAPTATRAVVLDTGTDNENYTSTGTIDLIWNSSDENNLVDIMLWFKGLQIRESEILNWVISNKQLNGVQ